MSILSLVLAVLMLLVFSKNVYTSSLTSFFTFYLIERFHLSVQAAQVQLFVFMAAIAVGTTLGAIAIGVLLFASHGWFVVLWLPRQATFPWLRTSVA